MSAETKLDALAVGAHPDDAELGCGATLALLAAAGRRVGILHLTRGEAGTRGTAAGREREARAAADALGAVAVELLDCGDGGLRTGREEEDAVIAVVRRWRPDLVLGPAPRDRHPDHGRAHRLVEAACFYAGLEKRGDGAPFRPAMTCSYMQHDDFEPSFVVDATSGWEAKLAALACYRSQLHQDGEAAEDAPATKVASPEFRAAVEGRSRHYGLLIGAERGEPFWTRLPVAVHDPLAILPRGLR